MKPFPQNLAVRYTFWWRKKRYHLSKVERKTNQLELAGISDRKNRITLGRRKNKNCAIQQPDEGTGSHKENGSRLSWAFWRLKTLLLCSMWHFSHQQRNADLHKIHRINRASFFIQKSRQSHLQVCLSNSSAKTKAFLGLFFYKSWLYQNVLKLCFWSVVFPLWF